MEINALTNLAWVLLGGGSFFFAMRYATRKKNKTPENADRAPTNPNSDPNADATLARDPVCGMSVEPSNDISWIHNGRKYYFCSMSCRGRFRNTPEKFVGLRDVASTEHV